MLPGSSTWAWRRGSVCVAVAIHTSRAAETAHLDLSCWSPSLSARGAMAKQALHEILRKDGLSVDDLAPGFCRSHAVAGLQSAPDLAADLYATFQTEVQPLLKALREPEDFALLYMLSPSGPPEEVKRKKLRGILANNGADSAWPVADAPRIAAPLQPDQGLWLLDAARWMLLGGEEVLQVLAKYGFRAVPAGRQKAFRYAPVLTLARSRGKFADVLDFHFGGVGRQSTVRCFSWVPELNGETGEPLQCLDSGTRPESMAAWWLGPAGPSDVEQRFDLTQPSGRRQLVGCLCDDTGAVLRWFEGRQELSQLLELPIGATAWFSTPAGKPMAGAFARSVQSWQATVRELAADRYTT